jgi:hypothetical protein
MEPILPTWFKYRQGKAEPAGTDTLRLTAPNLQEAFISIRQGEHQCWSAHLRLATDGPDAAATEPEFEDRNEAWAAAFELYRTRVVV